MGSGTGTAQAKTSVQTTATVGASRLVRCQKRNAAGASSRVEAWAPRAGCRLGGRVDKIATNQFYDRAERRNSRSSQSAARLYWAFCVVSIAAIAESAASASQSGKRTNRLDVGSLDWLPKGTIDLAWSVSRIGLDGSCLCNGVKLKQ